MRMKKLISRHKNILILMTVVWLFSFGYYHHQKVPVKTMDPRRVRTL